MPKSRLFFVVAIGVLLISPATGQVREDDREMVQFPAMMQEHMLGNMRDHLRALEEIYAALSRGDTEQATDIAENRVGMSSLGLHGAAQLAEFMPPPMQAMGTQLHRAASQFVIAVQNADTEQTFGSQQKVFAALSDVTAACNACHSAYRIR